MPISSLILNAAEEQLLQDQTVFHTKAAIDAKISALWAELKQEIEVCLATDGMRLPDRITAAQGRTYRGENLQSLPWRALDCPRHFAGADMFCLRTLLVWGRDFSLHFLLGGHWLHHYRPHLLAAHTSLAEQGWAMSLQSSAWDWSMSAQDYRPLSQMEAGECAHRMATQDWLKLSMSLPLSHFASVAAESAQRYAALLKNLQ